MKLSSVTCTAPIITPWEKGIFKFVEEWKCTCNFVDAPKITFFIPKGFETDFGSVPWIAQPFIPKQGDWGVSAAYFVHDWIYTCHVWSKEFADELLYLMLKDAGFGSAKAGVVKNAVKLFGGSAYKKGFDVKAREYQLAKMDSEFFDSH